MNLIKYFIGENYKYPNNNKVFKLKEKVNFVFKFECGHRVTDNVFLDLIRSKTGVQVYKEPIQLKMFNNE